MDYRPRLSKDETATRTTKSHDFRGTNDRNLSSNYGRIPYNTFGCEPAVFCLLCGCSMDQLKKQVAKARRRLIVGQFLSALVWCWFATLLIAMAAIGVEKWLLVDVDGW